MDIVKLMTQLAAPVKLTEEERKQFRAEQINRTVVAKLPLVIRIFV